MDFTLSQYLESYVLSYINIANAKKAEVRFECYNTDGTQNFDIKSMFELDELKVPFIAKNNGMFAISMFHITKEEIERYAKKTFKYPANDIYFILVKDCEEEFHLLECCSDEVFATHRFINVDPLDGFLGSGMWAKGCCS